MKKDELLIKRINDLDDAPRLILKTSVLMLIGKLDEMKSKLVELYEDIN